MCEALIMRNCTIKEMEFVVFIINKLADQLNKPISEIYKNLKDTDILDGYLLECYDVLHTFGSEYLMEDITELLKERGAL